VAIRLIDHPATHVGLAYQVDDEGTQLKLLHLAFHNDLRNDPLNISTESRYFLLVPLLHPTRLEFLATRCRQVAKRHPDLPYGFRLQRDAIFNDQGEYLVCCRNNALPQFLEIAASVRKRLLEAGFQEQPQLHLQLEAQY
jgi:hypothetical protein